MPGSTRRSAPAAWCATRARCCTAPRATWSPTLTATHVEPRELDDVMGPETFEPDTILSSGQGLAAMVETIDRLPPRCREAFVLFKFDGLSYAEVAARMGISVRTVEMQLRIAMDACWACLERTNGDEERPR
jgi:RNA polymerase sigma factor (sigma-70 family)